MKSLIILAIILSNGAIMLLAKSGLCETETPILQSKIENLSQKLTEYMVNKDLEQLSHSYSDDISLVIDLQMKISNIQQARTYYRALFTQYDFISIESSTYEVIALGKRVLETGTYKISFKSNQRGGKHNEVGKYLRIWRKNKKGHMSIAIEYRNNSRKPSNNRILLSGNGKMSSSHQKHQRKIDQAINQQQLKMVKIIKDRIVDHNGRFSMYTHDGIFLRYEQKMVVGSAALKSHFSIYDGIQSVIFKQLDIGARRNDYLIEHGFYSL